MPEERLIRRRLPSIDRKIADIHPEMDVRIRLTGTIIDVSSNFIVIDDGSGKIEVSFEEQPNVIRGQLIRIIARVLPMIDGFECRGESIQTMDGFDIDLYNKAKSLVKR